MFAVPPHPPRVVIAHTQELDQRGTRTRLQRMVASITHGNRARILGATRQPSERSLVDAEYRAFLMDLKPENYALHLVGYGLGAVHVLRAARDLRRVREVTLVLPKFHAIDDLANAKRPRRSWSTRPENMDRLRTRRDELLEKQRSGPTQADTRQLLARMQRALDHEHFDPATEFGGLEQRVVVIDTEAAIRHAERDLFGGSFPATFESARAPWVQTYLHGTKTGRPRRPDNQLHQLDNLMRDLYPERVSHVHPQSTSKPGNTHPLARRLMREGWDPVHDPKAIRIQQLLNNLRSAPGPNRRRALDDIDILYVDSEHHGLNHKFLDATQIGWVTTAGSQMVGHPYQIELCSDVNPLAEKGDPLGPKIEDALLELLNAMQNRLVVFHGGDWAVLRKLILILGLDPSGADHLVIDSRKLVEHMEGDDFKAGNCKIAKSYGVDTSGAHTADRDAEITSEWFPQWAKPRFESVGSLLDAMGAARRRTDRRPPGHNTHGQNNERVGEPRDFPRSQESAQPLPTSPTQQARSFQEEISDA